MKKRAHSLSQNLDDAPSKKNSSKRTPVQPYLETVDVKKLDFDLEKICSVTLSPLNVYCCLVCGRYLQGRGEKTVAFLHSIQEDHHIFINFVTLKTYLLPEDREVQGVQLLETIKFAISPKYTQEDLSMFPRKCFDKSNTPYVNGYIGLNDVGENTQLSVVIQMIAHMTPLRDFFLLEPQAEIGDELIKRLALLMKKLWSPHLLKAHLSPYELNQQLSRVNKSAGSNSKVKDPKIFMLWLVNYMIANAHPLKNVLARNMRGEVEIHSIVVREQRTAGEKGLEFFEDETTETITHSKFWILSLDLPPVSLFNDGSNTNSIPQVTLESLLAKFSGCKKTPTREGLKQYKIVKFPRFLAIHFDRFKWEAAMPIRNRNKTLVKFADTLQLENKSYKLVTNITLHPVRHNRSGDEDVDDEARWKIQVSDPKNAEWFEIDGKSVAPKEKELLFLDETYIQVWELEQKKS
ncbi:LAQU0S24e00606g1_1 [Lachancea quebecensis]|uniref:LAQU0S24e00606g1_1 n=1 Tax=Lachancea quebecensis TaxID=1654605 RepID=A0A0P1L5K4_9SACH|nr:LAQU0S24e00606g1_1 [Lachancea quebecensis]